MKRIFVVLIALVLVLTGGCSQSTPMPDKNLVGDQPMSTPTRGPDPSTPPEIKQTLPAFDVPPIYIIIDESSSMVINDPAGPACDPDKWRYRIPLLMLNALNDLKSKLRFVAGQPLLLYWLKNSSVIQNSAEVDLLASVVKRLRSFDNEPNERRGEPQFVKALEKYKQGLSSKPKSVLFMFTDGDFRVERGGSETVGNDESDNFITLLEKIKEDYPESKMVFNLLCSRRLDDPDPNQSNDDYLKRKWVEARQYADVYGLEETDVNANPKKLIVESMGSFMEVLGFSKSPDGNSADNNDLYQKTSGWNVIDANYSAQLPPNIAYLRYGVFSIEPQNVSEGINGVVMLDDSGGVPDENSVISPLSQSCASNHNLHFLNISTMHFYWWLADFPLVSASFGSGVDNQYYIYNDEQDDVFANVTLSSRLNSTRLFTETDKWYRCLSFKSSGANEELDFSDQGIKIPTFNLGLDPLNFIPSLIEFKSFWKSSPMIEIETVTDGDKVAYRYFPRIKSSEIVRSESSDTGVDVEFKINLDFFQYKYYPAGWSPQQWQPQIKFEGEMCPEEISTDYLPPSTSDPLVVQYWVEYNTDNFLAIRLFGDEGSQLQKCVGVDVKWVNWPLNQEDLGWKTPPKITCNLLWKQSKPYNLERVDCK